MRIVKRYAVVSCHVERLLDDDVWGRYRALAERRPGGFAVASLLRPPDPAAGEREEPWLERARLLAALGPLGHHTHWTSPTHARPTGGGTGERVRREGEWLREQDLEPGFFAGGGWYTDVSVAAACAALGYADCTPRAVRPGYLPPGAPWAQLDRPARVALPDGSTLLALPTTHGVGDVVRAPHRLGDAVHVYFHDTDLLDRRRRLAVETALRLLALGRDRADLPSLARSAPTAPVPWSAVARGEAAAGRE